MTLPLPFSTLPIQIDQLWTPLHLLPLKIYLHIQVYLLYLLLLPHLLFVIPNLYVVFQCLCLKGPFSTSHIRPGSVIITFWAQKRFCYTEKGKMGIEAPSESSFRKKLSLAPVTRTLWIHKGIQRTYIFFNLKWQDLYINLTTYCIHERRP